jgi:hypothetical protein
VADYDLAEAAERRRSVVDAADGSAVAFREVGPVELKGVTGTMTVFAARRGGPT